ncbi:MAG: hypothetical protein P8H03_00020 [Emcibacteraceae bacterium]|nr:hypothetical protein [Emcibacteraceae bacterium]
MKIKYILSLLIAGSFFVSPDETLAQSNTYNRMINISTKVVRAKISNPQEIRYDYDEDNQNIVCGHLVDVTVNQGYKGGAENFKLFVTNKDIMLGEEYEYLIIARSNQYHSDTSKVAFTNCYDEKSTRMDVSSFPYLATNLRQQIFPIASYKREDNIVDPDTRVAKKGEWLMLVNRIANNSLPYKIPRRRLNNGNDDIIEEMSLAGFLRAFNLAE